MNLDESDFRNFAESAVTGLHWVGPDGVVLWVNQAELDMLGYTREEYVGHNIAEFHVDAAVIQDMDEAPLAELPPVPHEPATTRARERVVGCPPGLSDRVLSRPVRPNLPVRGTRQRSSHGCSLESAP